MRRIILDTDPGIDDAIALFLALASPEIHLEAITTVSGNVSVEQTTRNTLALLELAGRTDIPVAEGSNQPLKGQRIDAVHVHGQNGLGGIKLLEPRIKTVAQQAPELIVEKITEMPGEITIVAIGPLTNLALALQSEPRIAQNVREIVIMGGALRVPGNVTPAAEFNIYADPYAAQQVLHAAWPIRLVSLDVTQQTRLQRAQAELLAKNGNRVTHFIEQMLNHYFDVFAPPHNITSFAMHDPLCLAAVFQPELIIWETMMVDVEIKDSALLGKTTIRDQGKITSSAIKGSVGVKAEQFIQLFLERISKTFF